MNDQADLQEAIKARWSGSYDARDKVGRYVDKFTGRQRRGRNIWAQVVGNHGTYTVSIRLEGTNVTSACSCYKGKHGYCHHVVALAHTFLKTPDSFILIPTITVDTIAADAIALEGVKDLGSLGTYLNGVTLDELIDQLKKKGISQKAFAESLGMSIQHLSAVKRAERSHRTYHELGAIKLACVWVLTHLVDKR
jgi:hypothetical protein